MRTKRTTLSVINFSGKDIENIHVIVDHKDNWDTGMSRPDLNIKGPLANGDAKCERAEISLSTTNGCWFTIKLTFKDNSSLSFRANQWDAYSPPADGNYTQGLERSTENTHLSVYQMTGEDRYAYSNAYYIRPSQIPDNATWMSKLMQAKPAVKLNQITMPGSHDAGMYTNITDKARTQKLSILEQLKAGSRYFDLRIYAHYHGDLYTYHGPSDGGKLSDILDDVNTFLTESPEEMVFLKFRSYQRRDQESTVNLVTSKLNTKLYKSTITPQFTTQLLVNLKGKVVAAFTSAYKDFLDPSKGTHLYSDYGNENTGAYIPHASHQCLGVYDAYSHQSEFDIMKKDQMAKLTQYGGDDKKYLFLFSWTLTGSTDNVMDLQLLSGYANPQLAKTLHKISQQAENQKIDLPNIVYLDYVEPYLCKRIIDLNKI